MFKFLGFLLLIGIFGFFVVGVLFGRVIRFFGSGETTRPNRKRSDNKSRQSKSSNISSKKFSENEGEYITYEEVKDDE